ncbi:MAG TPA: deoxyribose-phosphate aldolase [Firmicutes bacterium]|nr:deoxyribose-phosphate aldolase [Bacillota bacterium]
MKMNKYFDHTLLAANATKSEIEQLCKEAKEYDFMSVCVNPYFVPLAKKELKGSDVKVCTVIGFPLGQMSTKAKVFEANDAVKMGADEVDMVINVSALKDRDYDYVRKEIHEIKEACEGKLLKVILECCYLSKDEIKKASQLAKEAGADFVKTSTGFGKGGAKAEDVKIMRETVGSGMGVKAAGGIHTLADFKAMVDAGANRIGCSHSVQIMEESKK